MSIEVYHDSVLREQWDDDARIYTSWEQDGTLTPSTPDVPNPRPYTDRENIDADLRSPASTMSTAEQNLRQQARQALTTNADYLALNPPTQAQVVAQVNALTRECSALIRLAVRAYIQ